MKAVLAVDLSKPSDAAVEFMAAKPFKVPVELDLLSVVPPLPFVDVSGGGGLGVGPLPDVGQFIAEEERLVQGILDQTGERLQAAFPTLSKVVKIGSPDSEIRQYVEDSNAELVVMGAVGHSAVARVLLGSVSDYVATHVNASALVVRTRPVQTTPMPLNRVLLAIGGSEKDAMLVNQLRWFDLSPATEIHLVHIAQTMGFFRQDIKEQTSDFWLRARVAAMEHLQAMKASLVSLGMEVKTSLLTESHVGEALVVYADENSCDLLLVSDQRRSVFDRVILGSTSRYVLRHAHCSVMITRSHQEAT